MNAEKLQNLDPRINAYRADLADEKLKGTLSADRYVAPQTANVKTPVIDIRSTPDETKSITSQLLYGQKADVFEKGPLWSWLQGCDDGYVGYVKSDQLEFRRNGTITHVVSAPTTFVYPEAELKAPVIRTLSMGSQVEIVGETTLRGTTYANLQDGSAMIAKHLRPVAQMQIDYVQVCMKLLNVPYLWGGSSAFGIDCSGLVQLAMRETGIFVARDSDMQAEQIGIEIEAGENFENLRRGDLIFWAGHVAVVQGEIHGTKTIIHANGNTMNVASESLAPAVERIAHLYGKPTRYRRPDQLI